HRRRPNGPSSTAVFAYCPLVLLFGSEFMPERRSLGAMGDRTKDGQGFVAAVDVGSTMLRCHIYDVETAIRGSAAAKVVTHSPLPGVFEIDPEHLWKTFVDTIRSAIDAASLHASDIKALGISTQRGTFTTWDRSAGSPFFVVSLGGKKNVCQRGLMLAHGPFSNLLVREYSTR
ncbi:unnamed protein product, partial [Ixodes pacificus]